VPHVLHLPVQETPVERRPVPEEQLAQSRVPHSLVERYSLPVLPDQEQQWEQQDRALQLQLAYQGQREELSGPARQQAQQPRLPYQVQVSPSPVGWQPLDQSLREQPVLQQPMVWPVAQVLRVVRTLLRVAVLINPPAQIPRRAPLAEPVLQAARALPLVRVLLIERGPQGWRR